MQKYKIWSELFQRNNRICAETWGKRKSREGIIDGIFAHRQAFCRSYTTLCCFYAEIRGVNTARCKPESGLMQWQCQGQDDPDAAISPLRSRQAPGAATTPGVKQGFSEAKLRSCETVEPCKARLLSGPADLTPALGPRRVHKRWRVDAHEAKAYATCCMRAAASSSRRGSAPASLVGSDMIWRKLRAPGSPAIRPSMWRVMLLSLSPRAACRSSWA